MPSAHGSRAPMNMIVAPIANPSRTGLRRNARLLRAVVWLHDRPIPVSRADLVRAAGEVSALDLSALALKRHLGDKVTVQQAPNTILFGIAINNTVKPFTDVRVRKALTLGLDR